MRYKIEKISDDMFEGFHPNGYDIGFWAIGTIPLGGPVVGERLFFNRENYKPFATSIVTEDMDENGVFKTENSTYKLTKLEDYE